MSGKDSKEPKEIHSTDMVPVLINEFLSTQRVPVDIYIKMASDRYVQILKAGDDTQVERFQQYRQRDVERLYVAKSDYKLLVDQNLSIGGILLTRSELQNAKKIQILRQMSKVVFDELDSMNLSMPAYNHAKVLTKSTMDLVEAKPALSDLIEALGSNSGELVAHSIAVSAVSVMIAKQMGWTMGPTLEKLALGGLLHDIGLKELPHDFTKKPRTTWTYEEVQLYESHPQRAVRALQSIENIPDDLISIVYEHHEDMAGQGYPRKIKGVRIHPLAKVVAMANAFVELVFQSTNNPTPRTPIEALGYIERTLGQPYQREAFLALQEIVQGTNSSSSSDQKAA